MDTSLCIAFKKDGNPCTNKRKNDEFCGIHSKKGKDIEAPKIAITITYSESAENNIGMQQIGIKEKEGFTLQELQYAAEQFRSLGIETIIYDLGSVLDKTLEFENGYLLVAKNAVNTLLKEIDKTADDALNEQLSYEWDTTMYSTKHQREVNKNARHNVCFSDFSQKSDICNKKGTIISFVGVPCLNHIRECLPKFLGEKGNKLYAEGNKYYDTRKCYISYHGDFERVKVVAIRLGE